MNTRMLLASYGGVRDLFFSSVVLLAVNDNKGNGTTSFADQSNSAHALTAVGNAQYDTSDAPTGMTSSMLLNGSGSYLSTPDSVDWTLGNGDFTFECMVKYAVVTNDTFLISQATDSSGAGSWTLVGTLGATKKLDGYYTTGGTVATRRDVDNTAWTPGTTSWHHIAWTRNGANSYMFIDGTQHGATFNSGTDTIFDAATQICIGADNVGLAALNGRMACIRITKGVARYTANFTPPTLPFPTQ